MYQTEQKLQYEAEPCYQCPQGFECAGGFENLKLLPGYWSYTDLALKGNLQSNKSYICGITPSQQDKCLGSKNCLENKS